MNIKNSSRIIRTIPFVVLFVISIPHISFAQESKIIQIALFFDKRTEPETILLDTKKPPLIVGVCDQHMATSPNSYYALVVSETESVLGTYMLGSFILPIIISENFSKDPIESHVEFLNYGYGEICIPYFPSVTNVEIHRTNDNALLLSVDVSDSRESEVGTNQIQKSGEVVSGGSSTNAQSQLGNTKSLPVTVLFLIIFGFSLFGVLVARYLKSKGKKKEEIV